MKKTLASFLSLVLSALALGQVPDMNPPAELMKLDWMVGEWASTSKWTMEGMPPMDVTSTFKAEWDGQFLKQSATNEFVGFIKMTETMMLGYDVGKKQFVSYSFTNFAPVPRVEHGRLVGSTLVMVSEPWTVGAETVVGRATLVKVSDDELNMKLEFQNGDKWSVVNESVFKRAKK